MNRNKTIIIEKMPELPYAVEEAINRLRANVNFLGQDIKKIMVISAVPNEGKSFVAMHLWRQMAEAGSPSLFLDADLRNSCIVENYDLKTPDKSRLLGISQYLSGDISLEQVIYHTEYAKGDIIPNVDNVINPSLLLESSRMKDLLSYAETKYRYIFIDSAPLGIVSDGEILGNFCDGAILCIHGGETPKSIVRDAINQLERSDCPLLGIVLNRVESKAGRYYHKYYGKKYSSK